MKVKLMLTVILSLLATSLDAACCNTRTTTYYRSNYCCTPGSDCNCADNGWKYNDCISRCKYCEAFGNIGAFRD